MGKDTEDVKTKQPKSASDAFRDGFNKVQMQYQREQKSSEFDAKLQALANKAVDMQLKYGEEHYLTQILTTFLDVAIQLREVMETLSSINVAMECLNEAITFIDDAMIYDEQIMGEWQQQNYGFFARRKRKRKMRQVINNNVGRMKSVVDGLMLKYEMTMEITGALKNATGKMQKYMSKNGMSGKKGKNDAPPEKSAASMMIADIIKSRGENGDPAVGGSAPAGGTGAAPAKSNGGVSDISDII